MKRRQHDRQHSRITDIVSELEATITRRYSTASFEVFEGEDPPGTYHRATVDMDDPDQLTDLMLDRLLPLQMEERLPLYFIAAFPEERALAAIHSPHYGPSSPNCRMRRSGNS